MAAYNHCTFVGNLTRDPQLSYTPGQTAVVDFGLAINRKYTKADGTRAEDVCFIDVRGFGKTAENANKYLKKGTPVLVDGALAFEQWEKQDGTKHSRHRLVATLIQFLPDGKHNAGKTGNAAAPNDDIPF